MEEEKARLRAIDARPIKKVAEAKQRKRKRLQARREIALGFSLGLIGYVFVGVGVFLHLDP